jgi:Tfp pilus assembly protein PilV
VTAVAVIDVPSIRWNPADRWNRLVARLRGDEGMGLVELLIALLVLNIGIFATLAAFTSGALAIRRASHISTAAAVADKVMECFRNTSYDNIAWTVGKPCYATSTTGADGRTYNISATISTASQLTSGTYQGSGQVKVVTLTVTDPNDVHVKVKQSSTFSLCTQAALSSNSNPCQS